MMLCRTVIVVASALAIVSMADAADRTVVLVTSSDCAMDTISALDVRKVYLGIGVSYEGKSIRAFRIKGDDHLNQIFFQSVVVMSEKTYERRLLRLLLKYGQPRPREFDSAADVAAAIIENPCSIAYMWQSDAEASAGVKAIKNLWQEN
jgi:hypothetical protein